MKAKKFCRIHTKKSKLFYLCNIFLLYSPNQCICFVMFALIASILMQKTALRTRFQAYKYNFQVIK